MLWRRPTSRLGLRALTDPSTTSFGDEKEPARVPLATGGRLSSAEADRLHAEYYRTGDPAAQAALVDHYRGLAHLLAARATRRQGDAEDLDQVALIGLLEALRRFDPERGVAFTTFAWATVQGELKRHRRNHAWTMRVPRRLQEAYLRVASVTDELTQSLGRTPAIAEIAEATGDPVDLVIEALDVRSVYRSPTQGVAPAEDNLNAGGPDPGFTSVDDRATLGALIPRLPDREQQILTLRFVDQLTQSEIAERIGLSQMHVSRLLAHSLAALRQWWRGRA